MSTDRRDPQVAYKSLMKQHGPWQIVQSHEVYRDPWVRVRKDDVIRPDGQPGTYCVVDLKPGICVLAVDDEDHVFLTSEFHYGVGRETLEAVSGGVEADEDPLLAAQRELQEELGIRAGSWTEIGVCDPFTANVVSPTRLYVARELEFGEPSLEGTELIHPVKMPLSQAVERVVRGEITHAPSCLVILLLHQPRWAAR